MKKTAFIFHISGFRFLTALYLFASVPCCSPAAQRELSEVRKVEVGQKQKESHKFFQAERLQLTGTYTQNGIPVDLSATNTIVVWEITGWSDYTNTYAICTGVVSTVSNVVAFTLPPQSSNLPEGTYLGFVRALHSVSNALVQDLVLSYQTIAVEWSPGSINYSMVAPLPAPQIGTYTNRAIWFLSSAPRREISQVWKVEDALTVLLPTKFFMAEGIGLNGRATKGGAALDLSATNTIYVWEINGWNDYTNTYAIAVGTASTNGQLRFELPPWQSNLPEGTYRGFVRSLHSSDGTNLTTSEVLARQTIAVEWSPDSRHYGLVGPYTQPIYYSTNLIPGPQGLPGTNGLSAYEIAVSTGFVGTVEDWLTSLHGATGSNGVAGVAGQNGTNGLSAYEIAVSTGFVGIVEAWLTSLRGATGSNGVQGVQGPAGSNGLTGAKGDTGPAGTNDAAQIAIVAQSITNLFGDIQTLADVTNSMVSSELYDAPFFGMLNGRPSYADVDSVGGSLYVFFDGIKWNIGGDRSATNSSTSFLPPLTNWYFTEGINSSIQFLSGTDVQQQGKITNLTQRVTTLEAGCVTNLNQLLVQSELFTAETFDGAWYLSASNTWTNAAGWMAVGADIGTTGQVHFDSPTEYLVSPKTTGGYAYSVIDSYANHTSPLDIETSTNGIDWVDASGSKENVFVRYKLPVGLPPAVGTTYYTLLYSAAIYDFTVPEQFGGTNNFIGRKVEVDEPSTAKNPVTLAKLQADLAALRAEVYGSFAALGDVKMQSQRLMWDTNFYTVGTSSNGSVQVGWNRQPILEIFGGYTEFTTPIVEIGSITVNSITLKTTGSTGWRPMPQYRTNLMTGAWVSISSTNYSTTYPTLTDGKYTLSLTNIATVNFFRIMATNETGLTVGGTNMVNSLYTFQSMGKIINPGVPTSTNLQPAYTFWVDTNDANRVKVKMP